MHLPPLAYVAIGQSLRDERQVRQRDPALRGIGLRRQDQKNGRPQSDSELTANHRRADIPVRQAG
jgi:hypothetical protein